MTFTYPAASNGMRRRIERGGGQGAGFGGEYGHMVSTAGEVAVIRACAIVSSTQSDWLSPNVPWMPPAIVMGRIVG
jgi:hypothetical protein